MDQNTDSHPSAACRYSTILEQISFLHSMSVLLLWLLLHTRGKRWTARIAGQSAVWMSIKNWEHLLLLEKCRRSLVLSKAARTKTSGVNLRVRWEVWTLMATAS